MGQVLKLKDKNHECVQHGGHKICIYQKLQKISGDIEELL